MQRACVIVLASLAIPASASGYYLYNWNATTGNWNVVSNWDLGPFFGLPKATDDATIGNGGTATVSVPASIRVVRVEGGSTLDIRADLLATSGQMRIGEYAAGAVVHSDGLVQTSTMQFGESFGNAGGTYELSGSGQILATTAYIGKRSPGDMTQTGGSVGIANTAYVGWGRTSGYHLLGGTFEAKVVTLADADHPAYPGSVSAFEVGGSASFRAETVSVSKRTSNRGVFRILSSAADVTITKSLSIYGGWEAVAGSTVRMEGASLDIRATSASTVEGLANTTFVFDGAPGVAQLVEAACADLGTDPLRAAIGFQLGSIVVESGDVKVVDNADNQGDGVGNEVMYVDMVALGAGAVLDLGGKTVYARSTMIDPDAMVTDSVGGGRLAPFVPEPGTIAIVGAAGAVGVRRRRSPGAPPR